MMFRKLHLNDLNKLAGLFENHLFYLPQDKSADRSSPKKVVRQLFFHYIFSVPLSFFRLNLFVSFVAQTNDGNIIGSITARRYPFAKSWVIGPVVCHKDFRNRGITTHLMNLILTHLKTRKAASVLVSTEKDNEKGLMFFEKFGFEYLNYASPNHEGARDYVRKIAITYGYLLKPRKIQRIQSLRTEHMIGSTKRRKMWYILLKLID